jgi:hypothetical protein
MWANEVSVETRAAPEQVWRLWADVARWPEWNGDIERIELIGAFAAGGRILMTPIGDETVELRIAEALVARMSASISAAGAPISGRFAFSPRRPFPTS